MRYLKNFLKGIIAGMGGIAPGLSGSVLLVILGIYESTVSAIGTLFKNFKKNILFLLPLILGLACGVWLFSKLVSFLLAHYECYTRYAFLGLVLGTVPLFYRQVRKHGFHRGYYGVILAAAAVGFFLFNLNGSYFPTVADPNLFQSVLLGVMVAASSIVPGIDSAVILSSLGLYEVWVNAVDALNFQVLIPAGVGLLVGALVISIVMSFLLKKVYTLTFSIIFGWFISIIPKILNENCTINTATEGVICIVLALCGCMLSFYLGDIKANNARIKKSFKKTRT